MSLQMMWRGYTSAPCRLSDGIPQVSVLGPLWFFPFYIFLHLKSPFPFSLTVLLNIFLRHGEQDRATSPRQDLFIFWTNTLNHTIWSLIKPFLMIHFFKQRSLRCLSSLLSSQNPHSEGLPHGHHQITISMSTFSNIYHWFPVSDRFTLNRLMLAYEGRSRSTGNLRTPASGNFWNSASSLKTTSITQDMRKSCVKTLLSCLHCTIQLFFPPLALYMRLISNKHRSLFFHLLSMIKYFNFILHRFLNLSSPFTTLPTFCTLHNFIRESYTTFCC